MRRLLARLRRSIVLEPGRIAEASDLNAKPALRKVARGHIPVAAIVSDTRDNADGGPGVRATLHDVSDGMAGILHQRQRRHPGDNREPVGFRHLQIRQELDHRTAR